MLDGGGGIPIPATPLSTDAHHRCRMNDIADSYRTAAGDVRSVESQADSREARDIKTTQYSFWCNNKLLAKQAEYRCPEKNRNSFIDKSDKLVYLSRIEYGNNTKVLNDFGNTVEVKYNVCFRKLFYSFLGLIIETHSQKLWCKLQSNGVI